MKFLRWIDDTFYNLIVSGRLFYWIVLGLALFIGVYAAITSHWIVLVGSCAVIAFFVIYPHELD